MDEANDMFDEWCEADAADNCEELVNQREDALLSKSKSKGPNSHSTSAAKEADTLRCCDDSTDMMKFDAEQAQQEIALTAELLPEAVCPTASCPGPSSEFEPSKPSIHDDLVAFQKSWKGVVREAVDAVYGSQKALAAAQTSSGSLLVGGDQPGSTSELSLCMDATAGIVSFVAWKDPIRRTGRFARTDKDGRLISVCGFEKVHDFSGWKVIHPAIGIFPHRSRAADRPLIPTHVMMLSKMYSRAARAAECHPTGMKLPLSLDQCVVCQKGDAVSESLVDLLQACKSASTTAKAATYKESEADGSGSSYSSGPGSTSSHSAAASSFAASVPVFPPSSSNLKGGPEFTFDCVCCGFCFHLSCSEKMSEILASPHECEELCKDFPAEFQEMPEYLCQSISGREPLCKACQKVFRFRQHSQHQHQQRAGFQSSAVQPAS